MIEHDDVHAELPRAFHGRVVLAATVDGHQEACSCRREVFDPGLAQPIALSSPRQANRDRLCPTACGAEGERQQRCRGDAVGVVVAKDADRLAPAQRPRDAFGASVIPGSRCGSGASLSSALRKSAASADISQPPRQDGVDERVAMELRQAITQRDRLDPDKG